MLLILLSYFAAVFVIALAIAAVAFVIRSVLSRGLSARERLLQIVESSPVIAASVVKSFGCVVFYGVIVFFVVLAINGVGE